MIEKISAPLIPTPPYILAIGNSIGGNTSGGILFGNSANNLAQNSTKLFWDSTSELLGLGSNSFAQPARLQIKGKGATSGTVSLIVYDSNSVEKLRFKDDGAMVHSGIYLNPSLFIDTYFINHQNSAKTINSKYYKIYGNGAFTDTKTVSATFEVGGTNGGILPPRLTTVEKNAIATPPAGLMIFDTTLNKLCVYGAIGWETITSV